MSFWTKNVLYFRFKYTSLKVINDFKNKQQKSILFYYSEGL